MVVTTITWSVSALGGRSFHVWRYSPERESCGSAIILIAPEEKKEVRLYVCCADYTIRVIDPNANPNDSSSVSTLPVLLPPPNEVDDYGATPNSKPGVGGRERRHWHPGAITAMPASGQLLVADSISRSLFVIDLITGWAEKVGGGGPPFVRARKKKNHGRREVTPEPGGADGPALAAGFTQIDSVCVSADERFIFITDSDKIRCLDFYGEYQ